MTQDQELFELCKEVSKRTNWLTGEDESDFYFYKEAVEDDDFSIRYRNECPYYSADIYYPLYTSDYLLEKLPRYLGEYNIEMFYEEDEGSAPWIFGYHHDNIRLMLSNGRFAQGYGYTPLKALLKLVIALDDAGVKL